MLPQHLGVLDLGLYLPKIHVHLVLASLLPKQHGRVMERPRVINKDTETKGLILQSQPGQDCQLNSHWVSRGSGDQGGTSLLERSEGLDTEIAGNTASTAGPRR